MQLYLYDEILLRNKRDELLRQATNKMNESQTPC